MCRSVCQLLSRSYKLSLKDFVSRFFSNEAWSTKLREHLREESSWFSDSGYTAA